MRTLIPLLLLAALLASPALLTRQFRPQWCAGQQVKAEFVDVFWVQGLTYYRFVTPEGDEFGTVVESDASIPEMEWLAPRITPESVVQEIQDHEGRFLGQPVIVSIKKIFRNGYIVFSRVRLDPDPAAPRNTKVLPNQNITGKIWCEDAESGFDVLLVTEQGRRYVIEPYPGTARLDFSDWCRVSKTVTVNGNVFFQPDKDDILKTNNASSNYAHW